MNGKALRRLCWTCLAVVLLTLLLPSPGAAQDSCTNCWSGCEFFTTIWVFCMPVEQGGVGYCHCKERPCVASGSFCSVIWVTP
jgi:hypothetical protein